MARLNIEDSLFSDDRLLALIEKLGNRASAIGAVILAFKAAQKFWVPDQRPIPSVHFRSLPFSAELLACGLAEEIEDGEFVYVKGTREQFAWLLQRSNAGRENKGKTKERKQTKSKRAKTKPDGAEPPTLLPSPDPSPVPSQSSKLMYSVGEGAGAPPAPEGIKSPVGFFVANYVNAYQAKYGMKARPELGGKIQGRIRTFLADTPLERACELIQTYCQMDDSWFLTKGHDFETFMQNLTKVGLKLDTGRVVTRTEVRQADKASAFEAQLKRIAEGKV